MTSAVFVVCAGRAANMHAAGTAEHNRLHAHSPAETPTADTGNASNGLRPVHESTEHLGVFPCDNEVQFAKRRGTMPRPARHLPYELARHSNRASATSTPDVVG
jgi:hypothetical protein